MIVAKPSQVLAQQAHRPWPVPPLPWVMAQTWRDLLFAHWPVPVEMLRPLIPPDLILDTFDGQAWVGVVPFYITDIRPPLFPFMPFMSGFVELNVRTYVTFQNKPGVWFFSLDASNRLAVEGARIGYALPYFKADMKTHTDHDGTVHYTSHRTDHRIGSGEFRATYRPTSPVYYSEPGSLDEWLTERYCLYAARGNRIYRADIHHFRWPLQQAEAEIDLNTVASAHGITLPDVPPLLHFVKQLDVLTWYVIKA